MVKWLNKGQKGKLITYQSQQEHKTDRNNFVDMGNFFNLIKIKQTVDRQLVMAIYNSRDVIVSFSVATMLKAF